MFIDTNGFVLLLVNSITDLSLRSFGFSGSAKMKFTPVLIGTIRGLGKNGVKIASMVLIDFFSMFFNAMNTVNNFLS